MSISKVMEWYIVYIASFMLVYRRVKIDRLTEGCGGVHLASLMQKNQSCL